VCTTCFQINPSARYSVYIEARIYIPASSGVVANWPAWWTSGQNWPVTGEIDMAEGLSGAMTANYHSRHDDFSSGPFSSPYTGWHVFGVLWTTSYVTYYYDGTQVENYTKGIASAPNYVILQNAVGGSGGPTLVPADMMVDYVHVYTNNPTVPAVIPEQNYAGPGAT
jgi:beta-glucanase (GH16 family)